MIVIRIVRMIISLLGIFYLFRLFAPLLKSLRLKMRLLGLGGE